MEHLRYYVVIDNPLDKESVLAELKSSDGDEHIPQRPVNSEDDMSWSEHNAVFLLTEEEAERLKNDVRVRDVHRDPYEVGERPIAYGTRSGNYERTTNAPLSTSKNWGLIRTLFKNNNYGAQTTTSSSYTYNLDGTGVDVIIMDTGVEPYHPEFAVNADGSGGTRVVNYDWTQHGIISSIPTGGFYGDCDGHGSNVASILAGNTCGWAPGARIYTLRIVPSTGATEYDITDGRVLGLVNEYQAWGSIRAFHAAKAVDPITGYKRPTIVNCSYGYPNTYSSVKSITYRGTTYTTSTANASYGTLPDYGAHGIRYSSIDAEVSSTLNAGIIIVGAAGNDAHKIDVSAGTDYNNYWTKTNNATYYYHRGASPTAVSGVICVGTTSATANLSGVEHKKNFSCTGPRIDVWAPGDQIMGAYSNAAYVGAAVLDTRGSVSTSSGSSFYLQKISGTSQASPQVAGLIACLVQARPWLTPSEVKTWIQGVAVSYSFDEVFYGGSGYSNYGSLQGASPLMLYMPFNDPTKAKISVG